MAERLTDQFAPDGGYTRVALERIGAVLVVTLHRPEQLNAVDDRMHRELVHLIGALNEDQASNAVVLTGAGRAFCAGGDVAGMAHGDGSPLVTGPNAVHTPGWHLVQRMLALEKPIVAMVNGPAVGLGATLALLCDIVIMAEEAKIGDRHVQVGLVSGDGFPVAVALQTGINRAKELAMLGRLLPGGEAAALGLVSRAVPLVRLRDEVLSVAAELAAQPPFALRATKLALNRLARRSLDDVLETSLAWERQSMTREDHQRAVADWLARRG